MNTYTTEENNLTYFVLECTLKEMRDNHLSFEEFQNKHEYNKVIIKEIGTLYNRFNIFHNEFGPSIIFNEIPGIQSSPGYHINGNPMKEKIFNRYKKLKHLENESLLQKNIL